MLKQRTIKRSLDCYSQLEETAESDLYNYRQDIDGLRGIAVVAVIIFHANRLLMPSGLRGVDVFFVISGYVVTASILRHRSQNLTQYLTNFYKRRILRLMPALLACILITSVVGSLFIRPDAFVEALNVGARALIGWSNNYLISSGSDYFGLETELNPFTHTWSLGVEEQFYLVFPIILALIYGLRRPVKNKRIAVLALAALVVASALYCLQINLSEPLKVYYFMPSRFWEMASGGLLFSTLVAWPKLATIFKQRWLSYSTQILACLLIGLAFTTTSFQHVSTAKGAAIATLGTLLFIAAGLNRKSLLNRFLAGSLWTYLGKISYSLYLWHWPVFVLFRWTIGIDSHIKALAALCVAVALSLFSYYFIEQPIRKLKALHYRRVFAIALAGILLVGTCNAAVAKTALEGNGLYLYREYERNDWYVPLEKIQIENSQISRGNCAIQKDSFSPPALEKQFETCTHQPKAPTSPHIFLIGDSHAEATIPMLSAIAKETDIGVTSLFSSGCFTSLDMWYADPQCPQITSNTLDLIAKKAKANDIVLIASRYSVLNIHKSLNDEPNPVIVRASSQANITTPEDAYHQIEQELLEIAQRLKTIGVRLIVQAPFPEHPLHSEQCTPTWFSAGSELRPACFTDKSIVLDYRQPFVDALKVVQQQTDNLYVWDAFDQLCPGSSCSHFDKGKPLFLDDDHISAYESKALSSNFISYLKMHALL